MDVSKLQSTSAGPSSSSGLHFFQRLRHRCKELTNQQVNQLVYGHGNILLQCYTLNVDKSEGVFTFILIFVIVTKISLLGL